MYFTNADTMVQDLKAGNIDGATNLVANQMAQFENEPNITAEAIAVDAFNELGFNCYDSDDSKAHPTMRDPKFRQALNWAVDLQKVVELVWLGYSPPGTTIIPPDYYSDPDWHWEPTEDVKYTYDPEMAKQKLDEAGYPDSDGDGIARIQGQADRAEPDRAHRVEREPAVREAHLRLAQGRRHQGEDRGDGRRRPHGPPVRVRRATPSRPTTTCSSGAGTSTSTPARC